MDPESIEVVPELAAVGVTVFTTTRAVGSFAWDSTESARDVFGRWEALRAHLGAERLAAAQQVHGDRVIVHDGSWSGMLRAPAADGHLSRVAGTAMVVSLADCVPVFLAHPSGWFGVVHSGWKGTVANIAGAAIRQMVAAGCRADEIVCHCGPSICGACYEVGPEVFEQLTGTRPPGPTPVDLRALITARVRSLGVRHATVSARCTRCDNARFYSHRCGDVGRQLGVVFR